MRLEAHQRTSAPMIQRRVLRYLAGRSELMPPSWVAGAAWPGHHLRPQGAALAIGAHLSRKSKAGLVH